MLQRSLGTRALFASLMLASSPAALADDGAVAAPTEATEATGAAGEPTAAVGAESAAPAAPAAAAVSPQAADEPADPTTPALVGAAAVAPRPQGPTQGQIGVGMVAAGAVVAAGSTVAYTLVEALTTPDRDTAEISPEQETLASIGGFTSLAAVSVSAVVIVIGAGLAISASDQLGEGKTPAENAP